MTKAEFYNMLLHCGKQAGKKFMISNGQGKPVYGTAVRYFDDDFKKGIIARVPMGWTEDKGSFREHWYPCEMLTEV